MLGFHSVRAKCTRFQWWISIWLSLFVSLIGILTLGYVNADWDLRLLMYLSDKKKCHRCRPK